MSGYVVKISCTRNSKALWERKVWVPSGDLEELFNTMKARSDIFNYVVDVQSKHMGRPADLVHWKASQPARVYPTRIHA